RPTRSPTRWWAPPSDPVSAGGRYRMGPDKPSVSSLSLPLPRPVFPGARLAIVAPAGPFEVEAFQAGLNWLSQRYEVVHRDDSYSRQGYFAGSDARRLNELVEAI